MKAARILKADLEAAVRDAIAIEHAAQERTRELDAMRRQSEAAAADALAPEAAQRHRRDARRLRSQMDRVVADAAEGMADRLRLVAPGWWEALEEGASDA